MHFSIINLVACINTCTTCAYVQLQMAMSSSRSSLRVDNSVRGYHEYTCSVIWEPIMEDELRCDREVDNQHNLYAVSAPSPLRFSS